MIEHEREVRAKVLSPASTSEEQAFAASTLERARTRVISGAVEKSSREPRGARRLVVGSGDLVISMGLTFRTVSLRCTPAAPRA
jgi:hypothetical protein